MQPVESITKTFRIRSDDLRRCFIHGCINPPTERLPDRMQLREYIWCKPHVDMLAAMISKRDYEDFVEVFRQNGITSDPALTDGNEPSEKRRCCVARCKDKILTGINFEPYKMPGYAWTCDRHAFAVNFVSRQLNGQHLIYELALKRNPRKGQDPHAEKRRKAILEAAARYYGKPSYMEHVCEYLQKKRVEMLENWVTEWNHKYSLGLQAWDWLVAYRKRECKHRIQNYISRIAQLKLKCAEN